MEPTLDRLFLDFSARKLRQLNERIAECAGRLNQEQLWTRAAEEQNAVGNLLLHLAGNVRQWLVHGIGGKPDVRVRDREFSARGDIPGADLVARLADVVDEAAGILERVSPEQLSERVAIQKYDLTKLEAIYHVVEHFSQHTGQIILLTKLVTGSGMGFYKHLEGPSAHGKSTP